MAKVKWQTLTIPIRLIQDHQQSAVADMRESIAQLNGDIRIHERSSSFPLADRSHIRHEDGALSDLREDRAYQIRRSGNTFSVVVEFDLLPLHHSRVGVEFVQRNLKRLTDEMSPDITGCIALPGPKDLQLAHLLLHGAWLLEATGGHDRTVFGEGIRRVRLPNGIG